MWLNAYSCSYSPIVICETIGALKAGWCTTSNMLFSKSSNKEIIITTKVIRYINKT